MSRKGRTKPDASKAKPRRRRAPSEPDPVEQASLHSFPASDPPPWMLGHATVTKRAGDGRDVVRARRRRPSERGRAPRPSRSREKKSVEDRPTHAMHVRSQDPGKDASHARDREG